MNAPNSLERFQLEFEHQESVMDFNELKQQVRKLKRMRLCKTKK